MAFGPKTLAPVYLYVRHTVPPLGSQPKRGPMNHNEIDALVVTSLLELAAAIDAMAEPSQSDPWVKMLPLCRANEAQASLFTKRVVSAARDAGASWAAIGRAFGVTRQAACAGMAEQRPSRWPSSSRCLTRQCQTNKD